MKKQFLKWKEWKPTLRGWLQLLFVLGLFFMPFNTYSGIPFLGEYQNDASVPFLLMGFGLVVIDIAMRKKLIVPLHTLATKLLVIFLIWSIATFLINLPEIKEHFFKNTFGIERFIRQYIALLFSAVLFFYFFYYIVRNHTLVELLKSIRGILLISLLFVSFYAMFEFLAVRLRLSPAYTVLGIFNYFPFIERTYFRDRISSVASEAPYLAIYLITIAGWMFSYVVTHQRKWYRFLPLLVVLILTFFSGSRTGMVVVLLQLGVFVLLLMRDIKYRKPILQFLGVAVLLAVFIYLLSPRTVNEEVSDKLDSLNFEKNLFENISNKSRFGMQVASLKTFSHNPIVGVGFGQQSYHNRYFYPYWAVRNNWEFELLYKNRNFESFPPGYNLYTRLLAETGIIGAGIYLLFLLVLIWRSFRYALSKDKDIRVLSEVLLVSFIGFSVNWFQIDSFRMYGFWLCVALFCYLEIEYNRRKQEGLDEGKDHA